MQAGMLTFVGGKAGKVQEGFDQASRQLESAIDQAPEKVAGAVQQVLVRSTIPSFQLEKLFHAISLPFFSQFPHLSLPPSNCQGPREGCWSCATSFAAPSLFFFLKNLLSSSQEQE